MIDSKYIAKTYDIEERIEALALALLSIKGVEKVEFDLNGYLDDIYQVIIIFKYSVNPVDWKSESYYEARKKMLSRVKSKAKAAGLIRTSDSIQDMGEHYYLVYNSAQWNKDKEYALFYEYKGHEIPAGSEGWVPTREIANKLLQYHKTRDFLKDRTLYIKERKREREYQPLTQRYKNKTVYNGDHFYWNALSVGDYVSEKIANYVFNCMQPACDRSSCLQLGEPYSTRIDENGKDKSVYHTLKKVDEGIWMYCGKCFRGESVERGTAPYYV